MARPDINDYDMATPTGQAAWAAAQYRHGAEGLPVQDDQDDREALDDSPHTAKANSALGTVNHTTDAFGNKTYTGGNIVTVAANAAGVDALPEDTQSTEDLEQEAITVGPAIQSGHAFDRGGFIGDHYVGAYGPYADGLTLAEASKMTGEKFF